MTTPGAWVPPPPWKGPPLPSWMVRRLPPLIPPGSFRWTPGSLAPVEEVAVPVEVLPLLPSPLPAPRGAVPDPSQTSDEGTQDSMEDELVLVMKRRNPNPTWLKPHQGRFVKAMAIAGERTAHLTGKERVREMNRVAAEEVARLKLEEAGSA